MGLEARVERLSSVFREWMELTPAHYQDLSIHRAEGVPLAPQWQTYLDRARQGFVLFVGLRRNGKLIGYYLGFLGPGLHYETCLTCITDLFFILPEERGGTGALRLFRTVERELRLRRCRLWFVGTKEHKPGAKRLLKAMGFTHAESTFAKWL